MGRESDGILGLPIRLVHEKLGLRPNQLSFIGLTAGVSAAVAVALGRLGLGMLLLALSQIIDGLDGGVARKYGLQSERGRLIEIFSDRVCEAVFFLALVIPGLAELKTALLAITAILLLTAVEPKSKFDPGFKRFMMYFGYALTAIFGIRGFEIALQVVFFANLASFAIGTVIADYRMQREIDEQTIQRRDDEDTAGIPRLPEDPPTFLSKLFR